MQNAKTVDASVAALTSDRNLCKPGFTEKSLRKSLESGRRKTQQDIQHFFAVVLGNSACAFCHLLCDGLVLFFLLSLLLENLDPFQKQVPCLILGEEGLEALFSKAPDSMLG